MYIRQIASHIQYHISHTTGINPSNFNPGDKAEVTYNVILTLRIFKATKTITINNL